MLMHRRARYRLGSVYEIINNRVSPGAIIFTSTLLRRYTFSPVYTFCVARFVIYVQYVTLTTAPEFYCQITCHNSQNSYYAWPAFVDLRNSQLRASHADFLQNVMIYFMNV